MSRGQDTGYVLGKAKLRFHLSSDVERLQRRLHTLVDAGDSVIVIEHDMQVIARIDWFIDVGPGEHLVFFGDSRNLR